MRWRGSEAALIFNEALGSFDDAKGDGADHGHDELPDVLQLGLPDASFNGSCTTTPDGYSSFLHSLLCPFLSTLQQLFGDGCIGAFRRGHNSDRLSMARTFSEAHCLAWLGGRRGGRWIGRVLVLSTIHTQHGLLKSVWFCASIPPSDPKGLMFPFPTFNGGRQLCSSSSSSGSCRLSFKTLS